MNRNSRGPSLPSTKTLVTLTALLAGLWLLGHGNVSQQKPVQVTTKTAPGGKEALRDQIVVNTESVSAAQTMNELLTNHTVAGTEPIVSTSQTSNKFEDITGKRPGVLISGMDNVNLLLSVQQDQFQNIADRGIRAIGLRIVAGGNSRCTIIQYESADLRTVNDVIVHGYSNGGVRWQEQLGEDGNWIEIPSTRTPVKNMSTEIWYAGFLEDGTENSIPTEVTINPANIAADGETTGSNQIKLEYIAKTLEGTTVFTNDIVQP